MKNSPKTKPAKPARTSSASSRRPASKLTGRGPQRRRPALSPTDLKTELTPLVDEALCLVIRGYVHASGNIENPDAYHLGMKMMEQGHQVIASASQILRAHNP